MIQWVKLLLDNKGNTPWMDTLPETNSLPLNIDQFQKETDIPTIHFPVQAVSFREGNFFRLAVVL